jgi:hypothetical protein
MRLRFAIQLWIYRIALLWGISALLLTLTAQGQDLDPTATGSATGWQNYDWLKSTDERAAEMAPGATLTASAAQDVSDPFAVVTSGSLWQEKYGVTYMQPLADSLKLSYATSAVTLDESSTAPLGSVADGIPDDLSHDQRVGIQFQPMDQLTLSGNVHDSSDDAGSPEDGVETRGGGLTAEGHLPLQSVLTLGMNLDTTTTGTLDTSTTTDQSCDAQLKAPLGKLPLTAVLKGHYEETASDGTAVSKLPSLEQSLVWKPADTTTLQAGLRQEQYQDFPGLTNDLNEAMFADWSQTLLPEVTWHSYAEVLNARNTNLAPAVPTTSGANGTAQSADPTNTLSTSFNDETVTFSTGPSFKLQKDLSASIEYSNRIDRNPQPGDVGQEQRVSVSLKGSF